MTTSVKIHSANYPVLVTRFGYDAQGLQVSFSEEVLIPSDGERTYHATTHLAVLARDIEYSDPRVPEHYRKG